MALTLGALGVVYGDIGTSPLYALRESFHGHHLPASPENVLGILSLIFWALVLVISVKYCTFVLRADNEGEGGILTLAGLIVRLRGRLRGRRWLVVPMGLFGVALLYGDGTITPAISVLSAVEGLEVLAPATKPYVIPITLAILAGLFAVQKRGTEKVGKVFGPLTLTWFLTLAVLGVSWIVRAPEVLAAINPAHAVTFFSHNGLLGFLVLGSVVLVITGGESLYVDLGHFGRGPIRNAWFAIVLPALLLNYFGQGAMLLTTPGVEHPFFELAPGWALPFVVVLATMATCIASQAVISGAFSLTLHLIQFGYLPRLTIKHTSEHHRGQIYLPAVNAFLFVVTVVFVLSFQSSANLAAAYGIAVTSTMTLTTILFFLFTRRRWQWPLWKSLAFLAVFLTIDGAFLSANLVKVADGGWVPLLLAAVLFTVMLTWKQGRTLAHDIQAEGQLPVEMFLDDLARRDIERVPGVAVFVSPRFATPSALLHNLKHNHVLHEKNVFLKVTTVSRPRVAQEQRVTIHPLGLGFYAVELNYGFFEQPCVADDLMKLKLDGKKLRPMETSYFVRRERLVVTPKKGPLGKLRKQLFAFIQHASTDTADYFGLPAGRVIELGERVQL
ncbi:MAG TPA: potassium transporter Kup [Rhodothermales bacterium]|nr:potassium transporter Kup [Rhodothermales bacterium]